MTFFKLTHLLIILSIFSQSLMAAGSVSFEHENQAPVSISHDAGESQDHHQQDQQCHFHGHCHHLHYAYWPMHTYKAKNIPAHFYSAYQPFLVNITLQSLYRPPKV